ncbi:MAG: T9SS type A sorting domain-containing protein, partial [Cytophagales bacterium]
GPTSNSFGGKLAELVIYTAAPSPLQQEQVQSYLAIKYGLTKVSANNGGTAEDERDYFASDSSVIWDYSVNSGFNGVITGIGRDDDGGLNQLQSKNEGSDGVATMQRSGSFSRDLSYVLWGNNQLSGISSNVTSAFDGRSRRMIFVDKTDSANGDNLNLTYDLAAGSIPLTGNSADYRLLINGSSDFSSIDHILSGGVLVGNELSFSGISDINDGDYITIGIVVGALEGPGDVVAGLQLWLQANKGVTGANPVTAWADQSGIGYSAVQTGNSPDLLNSEINFNPVLDFDRTNSEYLEITNGILGSGLYDELWIYAVSKTDNSSTTNTLLFENLNGGGQILTALLPWSNDNVYFDFGSNGGAGRINGNWLANYGDPYLWTFGTSTSLSTPNGTRKTVSRDGFVLFSNNNSDDGTGNNQDFYIGGGYSNGAPTNNSFGGKIAELIVYTSSPTAMEQERVHSYLALKYGLTKQSADNLTTTEDERDYFASDSTVIWDFSANVGYNNDITGIMLDSGSILSQLESKNESADAYITIRNPSSINSIEAMMWGNNDSAMNSTGVTDLPHSEGIVARLARVWKIQEHGDVGTVDIRVDLSAAPNSKTAADLRVLIDKNQNGIFGDETVGGGGIVGTATDLGSEVFEFTGIDLSDGDFFTIGSVDLNTPLPLELLSFTAYFDENNNNAILNWKTASEENVGVFEIEKSRDALNFNKIADVSVWESTEPIKSYSFTDEHPFEGRSFYRLKIVDKDDSFKFSRIVDINNGTALSEIIIKPNPAKDAFSLLGIQDSQAIISITDLKGKEFKVSSYKKGEEIIFNISDLNAGMYMIKVETLSNSVVFRLIVQ